jgi:hypothetical protein
MNPFTRCRLRHCQSLITNDGWYPEPVADLCGACRAKAQRACPHRMVEPMVTWRRNGTPDLVRICQHCGHKLGGIKLTAIPDWQARNVWRDYRNQAEPCQRCGAPVSEYHHWAPRSLFDDYEKWPGDWLCPECHTLWHHTTGVATA